jgi:hypothetical protein
MRESLHRSFSAMIHSRERQHQAECRRGDVFPKGFVPAVLPDYLCLQRKNWLRRQIG